jgi:hypothetical protein
MTLSPEINENESMRDVWFTSMSRAQLKVAGGGWVDDTTLQLAQRQAERR